MGVVWCADLATEKQIAKALAFRLGFPYINLGEDPPGPAAVVLIPKEVALKRVCIAVKLEKNLLTVAMSDPLLFSLVQDLEFQTGYRIKQVVATRGDINEAIDLKLARTKGWCATNAGKPGELAMARAKLRTARGRGPRRRRCRRKRGSRGGVENDVFEPVAGLKERSEAAPIIDLVDLVVKSAIKSKASDVHVEPMEKAVLIRHRLDGLLKKSGAAQVGPPGADRAAQDHGGHGRPPRSRLPQDGRLRSTRRRRHQRSTSVCPCCGRCSARRS